MQAGEKELVAAALLDGVLRRVGTARLRVSGGSMFPAIRSGDVVTVEGCAFDELRRGDIVLVRDRERLFVHRVLDLKNDRGEPELLLRGDAHWSSDPRRPAASLLGRVVAVARGRQAVALSALSWRDRLRGLTAAESTRLGRQLRSFLRKHIRD